MHYIHYQPGRFPNHYKQGKYYGYFEDQQIKYCIEFETQNVKIQTQTAMWDIFYTVLEPGGWSRIKTAAAIHLLIRGHVDCVLQHSRCTSSPCPV